MAYLHVGTDTQGCHSVINGPSGPTNISILMSGRNKVLSSNVTTHSFLERTVLWMIDCALFDLVWFFLAPESTEEDRVLSIQYLLFIFYVTENKSFISAFFLSAHLSKMQFMLLGFIRVSWTLSKHSWPKKGGSSQEIWIQELPLLLIHYFKVTLLDSHI